MTQLVNDLKARTKYTLEIWLVAGLVIWLLYSYTDLGNDLAGVWAKIRICLDAPYACTHPIRGPIMGANQKRRNLQNPAFQCSTERKLHSQVVDLFVGA